MHFALVAIAELTHDGPPIVENLVTNVHTYVDHVTFENAGKYYIGGFRHSKPYPIWHVRTDSQYGKCPHQI